MIAFDQALVVAARDGSTPTALVKISSKGKTIIGMQHKRTPRTTFKTN